MTRTSLSNLTTGARAHLLAGGCSGDLCRACKGTGVEGEMDHSRGTMVFGSCSCCFGRGTR